MLEQVQQEEGEQLLGAAVEEVLGRGEEELVVAQHEREGEGVCLEWFVALDLGHCWSHLDSERVSELSAEALTVTREE